MPYKTKAEQYAASRKWRLRINKLRRPLGVCLNCANPSNGARLCPYCSDKARKANREYMAERRKRLLALGLCVKCGKSPCASATYCSTCLTKISKESADWKSKNPEKRKSVVRRWNAANPESLRAYNHDRRRRKLGLKGHHSVEQWLARVEYYGWRCAYCSVALTSKNLTKDHVIPVSKGGSEWPANLVPSCRFCNCSKHTNRHRTPHAAFGGGGCV